MRVQTLDEAGLDLARHLVPLLDARVRLSTGPGIVEPDAVEVVIGGRPDRPVFAALPRLRALIIPWAGLPPETRQLMRDFPKVAVYNSHHNAGAVAEMALALLLAAAKCVVPLDAALRRNDWRPRYQPSRSVTLAGRTAVILGYGAIGRQVARLCGGLGLEVVATRRSAASVVREAGVEIHPSTALSDLLPRAEVLVITLPLTDETRGLIGARELALLPNQAVLVNVGRGPVVDEAALYRALATRRLHSAGLDVWYTYPTSAWRQRFTRPARHPFGRLDNVVLSPHRAGDLGSEAMEQARAAAVAAIVNALARGEEPDSRVDVERGY
jgi:phosphoglycerate dehydrogenase-like enzyme